MTRCRRADSRLWFWGVTLVVVALSPAVLLCGELVNRRYLRRRRARPGGILPRPVARGLWKYRADRRPLIPRLAGRRVVLDSDSHLGHWPGRLASRFITNPVWIALTAPARWIADRLRPRAGRPGPGGPPPAGVREPRRPRPDEPVGVMELPEPTSL